jgi:hypothetical protein
VLRCEHFGSAGNKTILGKTYELSEQFRGLQRAFSLNNS